MTMDTLQGIDVMLLDIRPFTATVVEMTAPASCQCPLRIQYDVYERSLLVLGQQMQSVRKEQLHASRTPPECYRWPALTGLPSRKLISISFSLVGMRATTFFVAVSITDPPSG